MISKEENNNYIILTEWVCGAYHIRQSHRSGTVHILGLFTDYLTTIRQKLLKYPSFSLDLFPRVKMKS